MFPPSCTRAGRPRAAWRALALAWLAALLVASSASRVHAAAAPSALVVFGKAEARIQDIVYGVVDRVLRQAGWPLVPALAPNEAVIVRGCLGKDAPWPCVESMASKKGIERIVAVRVDLERSSDGSSQVVLTGRLVYSGSSTVLEQKRYCGACSDEDLAVYAEEISKLLMDERAVQAGTTKVGVTSVPMGAEVRIDGKVVGITNNVFSTFPGKHVVEIRARGYQAESRPVTAVDGKTVTTSVTLKPGDSSKPPVESPPDVGGGSVGGGSVGEGDEVSGGGGFRKWGPKVMVGAGALAVVAGAIVYSMDEDQTTYNPNDPNADKTYTDTAPIGVGVIAAGVVVAGAGGYLWWKWRPSASSAPTASLTSGGAIVGFAGSF